MGKRGRRRKEGRKKEKKATARGRWEKDVSEETNNPSNTPFTNIALPTTSPSEEPQASLRVPPPPGQVFLPLEGDLNKGAEEGKRGERQDIPREGMPILLGIRLWEERVGLGRERGQGGIWVPKVFLMMRLMGYCQGQGVLGVRILWVLCPISLLFLLLGPIFREILLWLLRPCCLLFLVDLILPNLEALILEVPLLGEGTQVPVVPLLLLLDPLLVLNIPLLRLPLRLLLFLLLILPLPFLLFLGIFLLPLGERLPFLLELKFLGINSILLNNKDNKVVANGDNNSNNKDNKVFNKICKVFLKGC